MTWKCVQTYEFRKGVPLNSLKSSIPSMTRFSFPLLFKLPVRFWASWDSTNSRASLPWLGNEYDPMSRNPIRLLTYENESHLVVPDSLQAHGLYSPCNSLGQNTGVGSLPSPGGLPNPGIEPRSPTLQADSSPAELPGSPKNTGVGSLTFLQRIFLIQELNQGLLHHR